MAKIAASDAVPIPTLRRIDPNREPGRLRRAYAALAATRAARFISRHVGWKLDPFLLRISGGRLASTLILPAAVLETTGARSGAHRRNAVIYFHDGDDVIITASNAGVPTHPSWYFNLVAHPDVRVGGLPMRAAEVDDEAERHRLYALADRVFPTFAIYRREAASSGRSIPVIRLTPRVPSNT